HGLCRLGAFAAILPRLLLALGLHSGIDRLAIFLGKVGAAQPDVDDLDAETLGFGGNVVADLAHDRSALVRQYVVQRHIAEDAAQAAADQRAQPGADPLLGTDRL